MGIFLEQGPEAGNNTNNEEDDDMIATMYGSYLWARHLATCFTRMISFILLTIALRVGKITEIGETAVPNGEVNCPRSQRWEAAEPRLKQRFLTPEPTVLMMIVFYEGLHLSQKGYRGLSKGM